MLGIALGAVCISAASGLFRQLKTILWVPGLLLAISGMVTAPLSKWFAESITDSWLILGFSMLAMLIATNMWCKAMHEPEQAHIVRANISPLENELNFVCRFNPSGQFQLSKLCIIALTLGGLIIGFLSGLFGVGGGF